MVVTNRYPRSLSGRQVLDGVPVHRWLFLNPTLDDLRCGRPDLFLASFYSYPLLLLQLRRLMQSFRPEVVNVHFPLSQLPPVRWLRRSFSFRLVISLHGHEIEQWFEADRRMGGGGLPMGKPDWRRGLHTLRSALQTADAVTACSRYLLERCIQLEPLAKKGSVIPNGVDLERFASREFHAHPRRYLLACGRMTHEKGFDLLLEAYARVAREHPGVDLILAGDGEDRLALRLRAERLRLEGQVHFPGRATPEEVVRLLNGCLFAVVPSRRETFGVVALEAMAAGKTVVATEVGGLPELMDGSLNRLVEPTVEGLVAGLAEWLGRTGELETLGQRNRALAAQYSWHRAAERYLEVYGSRRPDPDENVRMMSRFVGTAA